MLAFVHLLGLCAMGGLLWLRCVQGDAGETQPPVQRHETYAVGALNAAKRSHARRVRDDPYVQALGARMPGVIDWVQGVRELEKAVKQDEFNRQNHLVPVFAPHTGPHLRGMNA